MIDAECTELSAGCWSCNKLLHMERYVRIAPADTYEKKNKAQ